MGEVSTQVIPSMRGATSYGSDIPGEMPCKAETIRRGMLSLLRFSEGLLHVNHLL
jgi:hypothetical protein